MFIHVHICVQCDTGVGCVILARRERQFSLNSRIWSTSDNHVLMEWQCLVSVLRSLGTWTSRQRGNRVVYPDLSAPELQSSSSGAVPDDLESEVKDESKGPTQADEFEKAKALKVTMGSAVAKVYLFFC